MEEEESEEEEGWTLSPPEEEGEEGRRSRRRGRGTRRRPMRRPDGKINIGKRRERCVPGKKKEGRDGGGVELREERGCRVL